MSKDVEWQPWDTSAKIIMVTCVLIVLALTSVFVALALPH